MKVELIDVMGSDLSVVNAARVSYGKQVSTWSKRQQQLLNYLASHGHWTPFAHPHLSFRITASLAVAAQLKRHQVGLAVNEVSRRYVKDAPTFDLPDVWRSAPGPGQSKQGSGEELHSDLQIRYRLAFERAVRLCLEVYDDAIKYGGMAPEQARLVLPMATETQFYWTGSLYAFVRVCKERLAPDAQAETRDVALEIRDHLLERFPHSMEAWNLTPGSIIVKRDTNG